jgi:hypothetical protein
MPRENIPDSPPIRNSQSRRIHLLINGIARGWHEWRKESRQQVHSVQRRADCRRTSLWEIAEKVVIQFILLKEQIDSRSNRHRSIQPIFQPLPVHGLDVRGEQRIDTLLEVFDPRRIFYVFGVVGDRAGVLACDEFDDAVDEVADVVEEFGVVFCDKLAPKELGVGGFGAGGEEVVAEDGGGLAGDAGLVAKDADTTGL